MDVSKNGAKIVVPIPSRVPQHFELAFLPDSTKRRACEGYLATWKDDWRSVLIGTRSGDLAPVPRRYARYDITWAAFFKLEI
jgi:hypothetical protein